MLTSTLKHTEQDYSLRCLASFSRPEGPTFNKSTIKLGDFSYLRQQKYLQFFSKVQQFSIPSDSALRKLIFLTFLSFVPSFLDFQIILFHFFIETLIGFLLSWLLFLSLNSFIFYLYIVVQCFAYNKWFSSPVNLNFHVYFNLFLTACSFLTTVPGFVVL